MEIKMQYPYKTAAGKEIKTLTMRRPTVRDLRLAQKKKDSADIEIHMLASLLGLIPEDMDPMDQADYRTIQNQYLSMIEGHDKSIESDMAGDGAVGEVVSDAAQ